MTHNTLHTGKDKNSSQEEIVYKIFNSPLVQSIRETSANIEKIYEWEDMKNQDPEDVF